MTSLPPGDQPSFASPQDPWSGAQGAASPPTDPIPQPPVRGHFAQGVASPVAPAPNMWSQETMAHHDPYEPQRGGGRAGLYVLVAIVVLLLGGGGGLGAWYVITQRIGQPAVQPSQTVAQFDPAAVRVGDCIREALINQPPTNGTQPPPRKSLEIVDCSNADAHVVLKVAKGESIPENGAGDFDDATADAVCLGTENWDTSYAAWQATNDANDHFYCLDKPGA